MGEANYLKGLDFRAETVVAQMLKIVFPGFAFVRERADAHPFYGTMLCPGGG